jgi:hypothetical protein
VSNRELDRIRGLAALSVAVGRCAAATGLPGLGETYSDRPHMAATQLAFQLIDEDSDADAAAFFFVPSGSCREPAKAGPAV